MPIEMLSNLSLERGTRRKLLETRYADSVAKADVRAFNE